MTCPTCHSCCPCHPLPECCHGRTRALSRHGCCGFDYDTMLDHGRAANGLAVIQRDYFSTFNERDRTRRTRLGMELVRRLDKFILRESSHPVVAQQASELKIRIGEDIFGLSAAQQASGECPKPRKTQDELDLETVERTLARAEAEVERAEAAVERAREKRAEIENRRKDYFDDGTYLVFEQVGDHLTRPPQVFHKRNGQWWSSEQISSPSSWSVVRRALEGPYACYTVETMREVE